MPALAGYNSVAASVFLMRKRSIGSAAFVWHSGLIHQFPTMTYRRGVSPQIRVALNVSQKVGTFDMLLKTVIIRK